MDYLSLMGFPIEIVALAIICYTLVEITKLVANRRKDNAVEEKPAEIPADSSVG